MSAARMPSSALVRFCTWLLMTLTADCRRLMPAPIAPRKLGTLAMALSIWPRAVCALAPVASTKGSVEMLTAFAPVPSVLEDEATAPTAPPHWVVGEAADRQV